MRSTIYINIMNFKKLKAASEIMDISKDEIISILLSRLTNDNIFKANSYRSVQYQKTDPGTDWVTTHVKFEPVFYEKALDLRRNFKFSVSWFISFAIINYLDEIVKEITDPDNQLNIMDNYDHNFIYIAQKYGNVQGFIVLWGVPHERYLEKLIT